MNIYNKKHEEDRMINVGEEVKVEEYVVVSGKYELYKSKWSENHMIIAHY